jgi:hypothetical protein
LERLQVRLQRLARRLAVLVVTPQSRRLALAVSVEPSRLLAGRVELQRLLRPLVLVAQVGHSPLRQVRVLSQRSLVLVQVREALADSPRLLVVLAAQRPFRPA